MLSLCCYYYFNLSYTFRKKYLKVFDVNNDQKMTIKDSTGFQQKFVEEVYEHQWTIPNWFTRFQQPTTDLSDLKFEIFTGKPNRLQTKWIIGIIKNPVTDSCNCYWKMVEMNNFKGEIEVQINTTNLINKFWRESQLSKPKLNELIKVYRCLPVKPTEMQIDKNNLTLRLELVIKIPVNILVAQLHKINVMKAGADFLEILQDESTADLKIVTSDKKQLFAHKCILKARCPVFESMFRSKFSENDTGIVNVEDVSGKTMRILLHYFYSGKLLSSWKDSDIIVEFLYAAGKYQMDGVLEIVDLDLDVHFDKNGENSDLQEQLLDITNKLSLKNAEIRLHESLSKHKQNIGKDL